MKRMIQLSVMCVAVLVTSAVTSSSAYAVIISNTYSGSDISAFGVPDSMTYGQVFTAPVTGTLDSFTLYLNGGVGALHGAVGTWNGTAGWGSGFGEASNLYTSGSVASVGSGPYTFTPGVSVTAGNLYVAYLSVFGEGAAFTSTSMPLGTSAADINYFVWNNSSDPQNNPSWNYFFNAGDVFGFDDAQFEAEFTAVNTPEPTTMALLGLTTLGMGVVARRRLRKESSPVTA